MPSAEAALKIQRYHLYWANLDPTQGAKRRRPRQRPGPRSRTPAVFVAEHRSFCWIRARVCLSVASSARPRHKRVAQGAWSVAEGRRIRLAFLLGTFLWRSKEKYLACRGETRRGRSGVWWLIRPEFVCKGRKGIYWAANPGSHAWGSPAPARSRVRPTVTERPSISGTANIQRTPIGRE